MILMLFVGISVAKPKNYFTRWGNPSRGLLNWDQKTIRTICQHTDTHTHTHHPQAARSEKKNATHLIGLRWSGSVSRPFKDPFDSSTRSKSVASQIYIYASVCEYTFPSLAASLCGLCLASSTSAHHPCDHLNPRRSF